jgi:hypothetical protein
MQIQDKNSKSKQGLEGLIDVIFQEERTISESGEIPMELDDIIKVSEPIALGKRVKEFESDALDWQVVEGLPTVIKRQRVEVELPMVMS